MMNANVYAVILAGGSGTRFWPKSRQKSPKQLCKLGGSDKTMIEITLDRLDGFIPPERRLIVTHVDQAKSTKEIVGSSCRYVIAEPEARNTANALALAALEIERLHGLSGEPSPAIILSLHADHVVANVPALINAFKTGISLAMKGSLALIGVVPRFPETGYGYIEKGEPLDAPSSYRVTSFREKPTFEVAKSFVESKNFFWNAGLFVFPASTLLNEIQIRLPSTVANLRALLTQDNDKHLGFSELPQAKLLSVYQQLPKISIDHAVLEVSKNVSVVEADIGWQDVGSWESLNQSFPCDKDGNFIEGDHLLIETTNCTIDSDGPLIATLGIHDLVVVHAKGAILVCPKNRSQDVKHIVDQLRERNRFDLT